MSLNDEQRLLGSLIMDSSQARVVHGRVHGSDFANPHLGVVFDGIMAMISSGEHVDEITVMNKWPDWQVKMIEASNVFIWVDSSEVYPNASVEYAESVRNGALRREISHQAEYMVNEVKNSSSKPIEILTKVKNSIADVIDNGVSGDLVSKKLADVLSGSDSYDWLVPGLLERRDRLIVTGPEGGGKTTFIRQISILAAAGIHPMSFQKMKPVRVLVVDAENTEQQWRRAVRPIVEKAASRGSADPQQTIDIVAGRRIDVTRGQHLSEIHRLIDLHKPDMLMIGPLYKLVPKAINNDDDAAPLIVALDSLRDRGVTLIMEAHAGKGTNLEGERDLRPRGSAALLGWPEFGFGLQQIANDENMVELQRWRGDRDVNRIWPKHLMRGGLWPWEPAEKVHVEPRLEI